MKIPKILYCAIALCGAVFFASVQDVYDVPIAQIACSDPFILADESDHTYYMYSTGGGGRVMARASKDLEHWTNPFVVMQFTDSHWAGARAESWAAEVHKYQGRYYLFTTSSDGKNILMEHPEWAESRPQYTKTPFRATQIYVADSPRGPFRDFTNNTPHTPLDWASLDGTLYIEDGVPYMVFCREWLQVVDGTMEAVRLPDDLGVPVEAPFTLFRSSEAPWSKSYDNQGREDAVHVTDGPFLFRTQTGRLGMIWSAWEGDQYCLAAAYSLSGKIYGPWVQEKRPLFDRNGGHGMIFRDFSGALRLCFHVVRPDDPRKARRPEVRYLDDSTDRLILKD